MQNKFSKFLQQVELKTGASENQLLAFDENYRNLFTEDYWEFIQFSNGCEGSIGGSYLQLWAIEGIKPYNDLAGELLERTPELTIFGSDGGGMMFCYDHSNHYYVEIPLKVLDEEYKESCGVTFVYFLNYLFNRDESYRY